MKKHSNEGVRRFLTEEIAKGSASPVRAAIQRFGISRQAVNRHLSALVDEGLLVASGNTKQRQYSLKPLIDITHILQISPSLQEDKVWREKVRPSLEGVRPNIIEICQYGFTEILNNAIDHSEGTRVVIQLTRTVTDIELIVQDDGVGIFNKIKRELQLEDERQAILELAKGKLTTDSSRHSGEGIFFYKPGVRSL